MIRHLNVEAQREADLLAKNGDKELLREFASKTRCEYCGDFGPTDPHHVFSKGAGRADLRCNLISLDRKCHTAHHYSGKPSRQDLLTIVALREGIIAEDIKPAVDRIRNLDKDGKPRREMP